MITKGYIKTAMGTMLINGLSVPVFVRKNHFNYADILDALSNGDHDKALALFKEPSKNHLENEDLSNHEAFLHVLEYGKINGQDLTPYIENLKRNPDPQAVRSLFDFQLKHGLPITPDGFVLAYKGVGPDGYSIWANKNTKVLQGVANSIGQILNSVGATIEVDRGCVSSDPDIVCAEGLHAGSYEYAKNHGALLVLVKINPADVVSVPSDCNQQKIRCCKYAVEQVQGQKLESTGAVKSESVWKESDDVGAKIKSMLLNGEFRGLAVSQAYEKFNALSYGAFEKIITECGASLQCNGDKIYTWKILN